LSEAVGTGVERAHMDKYKPTEHHLVRLGSLADHVIVNKRWLSLSGLEAKNTIG
jgi:hypothetical protein